MKYDFSKRFDNIKPQTIRLMLARIHGDDAINFSPGFPDNRSFPIEDIQRISNEILQERPLELLQYASSPTYKPLVDAATKFFNSNENIVTKDDDMMITSGSGEGLNMASKVFLDEGDVIVCEDPTFMGATNGFLSNNCKLIGIPLEDDGMNLELLEQVFNSKPKPKLLYIIPTFQNPTCITTSLEKRKAIYDLCVKYNVMILEDNPYGYLRFKGESVPTLKSLDKEGIVIYCASLSKIISPGMRIGTVTARKEIIDRFRVLKGGADGSTNWWSQGVIARFLEQTDMQEHITKVKNLYQEKSTLMINTMKEQFHPSVKFIAPDGGMFVWFTLPDNIDLNEFVEASIALNIAIVPGTGFTVNPDTNCNSVRLSFTSATNEQIIDGITKLGKLTYQFAKM